MAKQIRPTTATTPPPAGYKAYDQKQTARFPLKIGKEAEGLTKVVDDSAEGEKMDCGPVDFFEEIISATENGVVSDVTLAIGQRHSNGRCEGTIVLDYFVKEDSSDQDQVRMCALIRYKAAVKCRTP